MENDICGIVADAAQIHERVKELAGAITRDYDGKPMTVIILANGAIFFAVDLLRLIPHRLQLDILAVSSYIGKQSSNEITIRSKLKIDVQDHYVLVIDDIYDSGLTLTHVVHELQQFSPREIKTCVLLEKRRSDQVGERPDYSGFDIENEFVVGYGLDYNECYRNLPYIGILDRNL